MKTGLLLMFFAFLGQVFTLSAKVKVEKNIAYTDQKDKISQQLNVYYNTNKSKTGDVIIFIHGGSWSSGKKETYWWLGRNLARKGVVTVTINYGLAPDQQYPQMATDCAAAVKWVAQNISAYGGNPDRIFLMGHSAGGQLAELINADPEYFTTVGFTGKIRGVILNDAFGLDMNEYLSKAEKDDNYYNFLRTFSSSPDTWTLGSPLHYISNVKNPHLIFYGSKTYPAIQLQSERINRNLKEHQVSTEMQVIKNKKHVGMISQMIFGCNSLYQSILSFMARH